MKIKEEAKISEAKEVLLRDGKNLVSDWMDKHHGSIVTDNNIFGEMQTRVKDPCTLTSVKFDSSPNHHYAKLVGDYAGTAT